MTQLAFLVSPDLLQNKLFDMKAARDGSLERFYCLKKALSNYGIKCDTIDICQESSIDILVCSDITPNLKFMLSVIRRNPFVKILYLPTEPPVVSCLHASFIMSNMPFDRILFWNDDFVARYDHAFKCNIGQPVINPKSIPHLPFQSKKFLVAITSSKLIRHKNGLHKERYVAFNFFSQKPIDFDLFGVGWDKVSLPFVHKSYRGTCATKRDVLKNYKFSICFENAKNYPGLITEKIFDCFAAGTVPIYYGPPNVKDFIPEGCFINFCDFPDYESLYKYLVNMSQEEYDEYLIAAKRFIESKEYYQFTSDGYASLLLMQVKSLLTEPAVNRNVLWFKWCFFRIFIAKPFFFLRNIRQTRRFLFDLFFTF